MYIYQIIGRANSAEDAQSLCGLFQHSLGRIQAPGYARGFCAVNQDDKTSVLIQEEWYNLSSFRSWQGSDEYHRLRASMQPLIEGVWGTETYVESP